MSASDRLGRLLFIVPYVAHRDGVPLDELADKLGVTPRQIESDLELLAMVGQPPLTPDHLIDLYVEDDVVYVDLDQNLSRPLRLTHEEARALVLATKLVGDLGGVGERLDGLVQKLMDLLNPVDREMVQALQDQIGLYRDGGAARGPSATLRQAVQERREVRVDYYSVSSDRQKRYRLQPLALLAHTGIEYLLALDVDAAHREKLFRLDRMAEAVLTDARFEPPTDIDLEKFRTSSIYSGSADGDTEAKVRFAPAVARVVRERFGDRAVETLPDGGVEVRLSTSSPAWLARWVLPFGTDAEILGQQRRAIGAMCREAAEAYGRDPG